MLHEGDELEEARQRAIESERLVIEAVNVRISHYEEMQGRAIVIQIPDSATAGGTASATHADSA